MSQSRSMTTRFSGRQDTYYAKIRTIARAVSAGEPEVVCPRDGCERPLHAAMDGAALVLRCPECGVIFRGNRQRIVDSA